MKEKKISDEGAWGPERRSKMKEANAISEKRTGDALRLLAAPFLGLIYAAFLPFIGIAMLIGVVAAKVTGKTAEEVLKGAGFRWVPGAAYLTGKKKKKEEK